MVDRWFGVDEGLEISAISADASSPFVEIADRRLLQMRGCCLAVARLNGDFYSRAVDVRGSGGCAVAGDFCRSAVAVRGGGRCAVAAAVDGGSLT